MKLKKYLPLLQLLFLAGCANQLPPGGGPTDTEPPEIISHYPPHGTIHFEDNYFELTFSEYVDKRSLKDAIFISPGIEGELELDWSGKSVRVYFPEKLIDSVTYTVSIGTDVIDYNNRNRMAQSVVFAFSTGDKIDNFVIGGKIYETTPSGTLLFAYRNPTDTLNPATTRPDYISQAGTKGEFLFTGLAGGKYRVFAVKEEIKDKVYDPEKDYIGVPHVEPFLSQKDTSYTGLNMILSLEDTTAPKLISGNMLDRFHVLVTLSEEVSLENFDAGNFIIVDSVTNRVINPVYFFKGRGREKEYFLSVQDSFPSSGNYYLIVKYVSDQSKNQTTSDYSSLNISDKSDTSKAAIIKVEPAYNAKNVDYMNAVFSFTLDDGFSVAELNNKYRFEDTVGNRIKTVLSKNDDASFTIKAEQELKSGTDYFIAFNLKYVKDLAGNSVDSMYVYKFKTLSELDFTGLSGTTSGIQINKKPILILENTEQKSQRYITSLNEDGSFSFKRVLPGKYDLMVLYDTDNNGKITPGIPVPYSKSEEFFYYKETITLLPRWAILDFFFDAEADR